MDEEGNFVRLGSGEDLLATIEGKDEVSVDIPEPNTWPRSSYQVCT